MLAGSSDLSDVTASVEHACNSFQSAQDSAQRSAAERVLLDFRRHDHAVRLGLIVLERSSVPFAQFHAVCAVKDGLSRDWASLAAEARAGLEQSVLALLAARDLERYVQAEACQLLALVAKRDAVDALQEVNGPAAPEAPNRPGRATGRLLERASGLFATADERQRLLALLLVNALVHEFGAPSEQGVGGLGVPQGLQQQARGEFEVAHLPHLFDSLHSLLLTAVRDSEASPAAALVTRTVNLVATVLGWDFVGNTHVAATPGPGAGAGAGGTGPGAGTNGGSRPGLLAATVRPPPTWRGRVDSPDLLSAACEQYARLRRLIAAGHREEPADRAVEEAVHAARQLLVQLASLHRTAFADEQAMVVHLAAVCGVLVQIASAPLPASAPPDAMGAEYLDLALMASRIVANASTAGLAQLPDAARGAFLDQLCTLAVRTAEVVASATDTSVLDDAWQVEAHEAFVDVWSSLVVQGSALVGPSAPAHSLAYYSSRVFAAGVHATLAVARLEGEALGNDEVTVHAEDDVASNVRFAALCAVGRADVLASAALLEAQLLDRTEQLRSQCVAIARDTGEQRGSVEALLEELDVLVRLAGHLLADAGDGEEPEMPRELAAITAHSAEGHPAPRVTASVLRLLALQDECVLGTGSASPAAGGGLAEAGGGVLPGGRPPADGMFAAVLSPRLAESLLWFLERWARTYLLTDEARTATLHPQLLLYWGRDTAAGSAMLVRCVEAAVLRLLCWGGEPILAMQATRLLHTLAKLQGASPLLAPLAAWQRILAAHSPGSMALAHLPPKAQRLLVEALVTGGFHAPTGMEATRYFDSLCGALNARLELLMSQGALDETACHAAVQQEVVALCQCIRAICRASARIDWRSVDSGTRAQVSASTYSFALTCTHGLLPPLLPCYVHALEPALQLLKVLADFVRTYARELPSEASAERLRQMAALALHVARIYTQVRCSPLLRPRLGCRGCGG